MKYLKSLFLIILLAVVGCTDSYNEVLVEEGLDGYEGVHVVVAVVDSEGNHLFSDEYNGILNSDSLMETVTYTYRGETRPYHGMRPAFQDEEMSKVITRKKEEYSPNLHDGYSYAWQRIMMKFGNFLPDSSHNETFTINWPDGTHNEIQFVSQKLTNPYSPGPAGWIRVRVDGGEWTDADYVTLVK